MKRLLKYIYHNNADLKSSPQTEQIEQTQQHEHADLAIGCIHSQRNPTQHRNEANIVLIREPFIHSFMEIISFFFFS